MDKGFLNAPDAIADPLSKTESRSMTGVSFDREGSYSESG